MTGLGRRLSARLAGTQAARADVAEAYRDHPPDVAAAVVAARLVDAEWRVVALLRGQGSGYEGDLAYYRAYHRAVVVLAGVRGKRGGER